MEAEEHTPEGSQIEPLVARARAGNRAAFDALVACFQDMTFATALAWLRDPARAEDAAQEAFFEAWCHLAQLRDDAAFPGFLRRIVYKHCDRATRRRAPAQVSLEEGSEPAGSAPGPEDALARREGRERLRAAIESLPAHERAALSVHVFAGLSLDETAAWLELPPSTVKKRVHSARARLRGGFDALAATTLALRPSRDARFSNLVRLFLSVREGDAEAVALILDEEPPLVEAEERWDEGLTREHALPVPAGGTPLVRAAERDHAGLVDLLVDRGADPNRACRCAGGEAPLWAAVANGAERATARLLARGADPNRAGFAGHTPLHVAAIRGSAALGELLLAHGADPTLRDQRGRTPADWSALKREALSPRTAAAPGSELVATGIRALDLFAPLAKGSLAHANFRAGQGGVVFAGELSRRWPCLAAGVGSAGRERRSVVWAGWTARPADLFELRHAFDELGLHDAARLVHDGADAPAGARGVAERAFDEALRLQGAGACDVLVVLFARRDRAAEIEAVLPRAGARDGGSITCLVMARDGEEVPDEGPLRAPWDARVTFESALARVQRWPALHPVWTTSRWLDPDSAGAEHCRVAESARALLARWRELDPDLDGSDGGHPDAVRARRLQDWLVQPFLVSEAVSGRLGEWTDHAALLAAARAIVEE